MKLQVLEIDIKLREKENANEEKWTEAQNEGQNRLSINSTTELSNNHYKVLQEVEEEVDEEEEVTLEDMLEEAVHECTKKSFNIEEMPAQEVENVL